MRALAVALLLTIPLALTGCIGTDETAAPQSIVDPATLPLDSVSLPSSAEITTTATSIVATLTDVELPFDHDITIPQGVTSVSITATAGVDDILYTYLRNEETGRRRCNPSYVDDGWTTRLGRHTCSGLTAVDRLPATWTVFASGTPAVADLVTIELRTSPVDGIAGLLDLDAIDKPVLGLQPTEETFIEAHDGARIYAQVTLPAADGPYPTIISSSPYNGPDHAAGEWSMWEYVVQDWAKRGYAVVSADVRGTGRSTGCMEVWGPNEQQDQVTLVEWVAEQPWSDGNVGFYGQSYVGTTPVAAAVNAPEALKAIIAVAPVISAYDDWHFGGVPNGENIGSPASYQTGTGVQSNVEPPEASPTYVENLVNNAVSGMCDATLAQRANDPRAIYDGFYEERNFSARAGDVTAAVLYTQGFEDTNVKSAMITHWFNALESPKLGLFGHWVHQHPSRMDQEVLFLGWMEQYVKGKAIGFEDVPNVDVVTNAGTHRLADAWPPLAGGEGVGETTLFPDFDGEALGPEPVDGSDEIVVGTVAAGAARDVQAVGGDAVPGPIDITLTGTVDEAVHLAGIAKLRLVARLDGAENAYVAATMYDVAPDGERTEITFGMANLAHRYGHDAYEPVMPGETVAMDLPFLPTEYVVEPGHTLEVVLYGTALLDWFAVNPTEAGVLTLYGGADGTQLVLPTVASVGEALAVSAGM